MSKDGTVTYKVRVHITMEKLLPNGGWSGESISIDQTLQLQADTFFQAVKILSEFDALAHVIKEKGV